MHQKARFRLLLAVFIIMIVIPQIPSSLTQHTRVSAGAKATQTTLTPRTWKDVLSGGLWARFNNLESNTTILDSSQAAAMFGSPTSEVSLSQLPSSKFTNNFRVTGNSGLFPLEDEPSIAVTNQSGHFLMVVGANSLITGKMVSYLSRDQGSSWAGPTFLPLSRSNDSFASDPALGVNRTGTFYYAFLSISPSISQDDLVVATSSDGVTWTN